MQDERSRRFSPIFSRFPSAWLPAAAIAAYALVVVGGFVQAVAGGIISGLAMAVLGAALFIYTNLRLGPAPSQPPRGGRAQLAQRRYSTLALVSVGTLYLVLAVGALVTDSRAMWSCLTLPICRTADSLALLAMGHRLLAIAATVLIAILLFQTWRVRPERPLKLASGWSLGLMLLGNAVGMVQLLLIQAGHGPAALIVRAAHLALGAAAWGVLVVLATLALRPAGGQQAAGTYAAPASAGRTAHNSKLKDYVSLTKPGVITLLIFTTLAAMFITPAGMPGLELVFWTLLGGWLMPAGAHALNCYFDCDIDAKMGRTGRRPLPSNRIPAWHALVLGITLGVMAFIVLALFVNLLTALLALAGFFYYVGIYTLWLKRRSPGNIVIGGGAGAFPPLVGWAAVTGSLTLPALLLFAIIFYWTPPHFWALALIRQKDYANAGVPMLPVVAGDEETRRQIVLYTIMMVALSLLLTPLQVMGLPYLASALILGVIFTRYAIQLYRMGTVSAAWGLYKFSLLYLALLFGAMVVDRTLLA